MLRLLLGLSLAFAGLSMLRSPCRDGRPRASAAAPAPNVVRLSLPEDAKGYGLTTELAQQDAERQAAQLVAEVLKRHNPPLQATPARLLKHARQHLVAGPGAELDDFAVDDEKVKGWSLPLRANPDWSAILRVEEVEHAHREAGLREARARARQSLSAKITMALGLVLAASAALGRKRRSCYRRV
jgi:hypothetical protein